MARRRKLEAPSAETLNALEEEFRSETPSRPNPATAPISQIAAEAAQTAQLDDPQTRLDRLDAQRARDADEKGLLISEIPTDQIKTDQMIRDRTILKQEELTELQLSIRANGLRLPIEVFVIDGGYALISGYRRLLAMQALAELNPGKYTTIKALIRKPHDSAKALTAMVEENEVRANLSHYERGRVAVIAVQQGTFGSTEEAVNVLFSTASKSKRSKVRSFAEVFEMLGDLLSYPEDMSERRGLRLAGALRQGGEGRLRAALETSDFANFDGEWSALEPVIAEVEDGPRDTPKRGRPKTNLQPPAGWEGDNTLHLSSGVTLRKEVDSQGYLIRLNGRAVDAETVDTAMEMLRRLFEEG